MNNLLKALARPQRNQIRGNLSAVEKIKSWDRMQGGIRKMRYTANEFNLADQKSAMAALDKERRAMGMSLIGGRTEYSGVTSKFGIMSNANSQWALSASGKILSAYGRATGRRN